MVSPDVLDKIEKSLLESQESTQRALKALGALRKEYMPPRAKRLNKKQRVAELKERLTWTTKSRS